MSKYLKVVCPVCLADRNEPCRSASKDQLDEGLPPGTKWSGVVRKRVHESRVDEYEYQYECASVDDVF